MQVGEIIHKLRKDKKMTLLELSKKSAVALATLSRMENGKMTGTLESHINICKALDTSLADLYRDLVDSSRKVDVQTGKAGPDLLIHDKKASSEMLALNVRGKKMMPVLIKLRRGGKTSKEETNPGVEKFAYVLEGRVEAQIGGEKYLLAKGDTLYFESAAAHHFRNIGTCDARIIAVICPPVI